MSQVEKLKQGDQNAFYNFVDMYKDKVVNTAYTYTLNNADAEDVAQDVFIEVYNSISKFKENSKLSTWVYRITISKSIDFIKRKNRKKRFAFVRSLYNDNDQAIPIIDESNNKPDSYIEENEHKKALHAAINKLPKNQQIAFKLNKIEELKYKEIADIMNTSTSSIEALLHRAKTNLKSILYAYYEKNLKE